MAQETLLDTLMALQPALQLTAEKLLRSEADSEAEAEEVLYPFPRINRPKTPVRRYCTPRPDYV